MGQNLLKQDSILVKLKLLKKWYLRKKEIKHFREIYEAGLGSRDEVSKLNPTGCFEIIVD